MIPEQIEEFVRTNKKAIEACSEAYEDEEWMRYGVGLLRLEEALSIITELQQQLEAEQEKNKRMRDFIIEWDGHYSSCGACREGFEGCDEAMFACSCGYQEAKQQALKE